MRIQLPPTGTMGQVCHYLGINEAAFKELQGSNEFPQPSEAGTHRRWAFSEIDAWLEARHTDAS